MRGVHVGPEIPLSDPLSYYLLDITQMQSIEVYMCLL